MAGKATNKQRAFAFEYVKDFNATQAAIRAGYSEKNAGKIGPELLGKPVVQALLAEIREKTESAAVMGLEEACEILTGIARAQVSDYVDDFGIVTLEKGNGHAVASVEQVKSGKYPVVKFKLHDKVGALQRLAKMRGWDVADQRNDVAKVAGVHFSLNMTLPPKPTPAIDVDAESVAVEDLSPGGFRADGEEA